MEFAKEALISNDISVVSLVHGATVYHLYCEQAKVPLFDEDILFENIRTVDQFWRRLRMFWSILYYGMILGYLNAGNL